MELTRKLLEQLTSNTRPKKEEQMLFVMEKPMHDENSSQPLKTNNKQFKISVTFLIGYHGIFNVKNKNNIFIFI